MSIDPASARNAALFQLAHNTTHQGLSLSGLAPEHRKELIAFTEGRGNADDFAARASSWPELRKLGVGFELNPSALRPRSGDAQTAALIVLEQLEPYLSDPTSSKTMNAIDKGMGLSALVRLQVMHKELLTHGPRMPDPAMVAYVMQSLACLEMIAIRELPVISDHARIRAKEVFEANQSLGVLRGVAYAIQELASGRALTPETNASILELTQRPELIDDALDMLMAMTEPEHRRDIVRTLMECDAYVETPTLKAAHNIALLIHGLDHAEDATLPADLGSHPLLAQLFARAGERVTVKYDEAKEVAGHCTSAKADGDQIRIQSSTSSVAVRVSHLASVRVGDEVVYDRKRDGEPNLARLQLSGKDLVLKFRGDIEVAGDIFSLRDSKVVGASPSVTLNGPEGRGAVMLAAVKSLTTVEGARLYDTAVEAAVVPLQLDELEDWESDFVWLAGEVCTSGGVIANPAELTELVETIENDAPEVAAQLGGAHLKYARDMVMEKPGYASDAVLARVESKMLVDVILRLLDKNLEPETHRKLALLGMSAALRSDSSNWSSLAGSVSVGTNTDRRAILAKVNGQVNGRTMMELMMRGETLDPRAAAISSFLTGGFIQVTTSTAQAEQSTHEPGDA